MGLASATSCLADALSRTQLADFGEASSARQTKLGAREMYEESRFHRRAKNVSRGHSAHRTCFHGPAARGSAHAHKDPRRKPGKKLSTRSGKGRKRGEREGGVETRGVKRGRPRQPWSGPPGRRGAYVGNCGARRVEAGQRGGLRQAAAAWPFGRYRRYPALPGTERN